MPPRDLRSLLGTLEGDRWLADPTNANELYQSLVGGANKPLRAEDRPPNDFIPAPKQEPVVQHVESERIALIYSSRDSNPGLGYPSCSRALARRIKPFRDNNGYYKHLGLLPSATTKEIRRALATRYRRTHPDTGWAPDTDEFMYLREIARVLLSPARRDRYDDLPEGDKWIDSRVRKEIEDLTGGNDAIVMEYVKDASAPTFQGGFRRVAPDPETMKIINDGVETPLQDRREAMRDASARNGFDFYAEPIRDGDFELAQQWYEHLVAVAPLFGYTRAMRVWLWDKDAEWSLFGGILKISRRWPPGRAQAFALFSVLGVS